MHHFSVTVDVYVFMHLYYPSTQFLFLLFCLWTYIFLLLQAWDDLLLHDPNQPTHSFQFSSGITSSEKRRCLSGSCFFPPPDRLWQHFYLSILYCNDSLYLSRDTRSVPYLPRSLVKLCLICSYLISSLIMIIFPSVYITGIRLSHSLHSHLMCSSLILHKGSVSLTAFVYGDAWSSLRTVDGQKQWIRLRQTSMVYWQ